MTCSVHLYLIRLHLHFKIEQLNWPKVIRNMKLMIRPTFRYNCIVIKESDCLTFNLTFHQQLFFKQHPLFALHLCCCKLFNYFRFQNCLSKHETVSIFFSFCKLWRPGSPSSYTYILHHAITTPLQTISNSQANIRYIGYHNKTNQWWSLWKVCPQMRLLVEIIAYKPHEKTFTENFQL